MAALAYRQGEPVIDSFLWPSEAKDRAPEFKAEPGFQVAHWKPRTVFAAELLGGPALVSGIHARHVALAPMPIRAVAAAVHAPAR